MTQDVPGATQQTAEIMEMLRKSPWQGAPTERDPRYAPTWKRVSITLQKFLRSWAPSLYFGELSHYEDRDEGYAYVVYQSCRLCRVTKTEFAYDIADPDILAKAVNMIGRPLQTTLAVAHAQRGAEDAGGDARAAAARGSDAGDRAGARRTASARASVGARASARLVAAPRY